MTIGGSDGHYLDDVELTSLNPELLPVPECLENLNSFPFEVAGHAGALDYSREFLIFFETRFFNRWGNSFSDRLHQAILG